MTFEEQCHCDTPTMCCYKEFFHGLKDCITTPASSKLVVSSFEIKTNIVKLYHNDILITEYILPNVIHNYFYPVEINMTKLDYEVIKIINFMYKDGKHFFETSKHLLASHNILMLT